MWGRNFVFNVNPRRSSTSISAIFHLSGLAGKNKIVVVCYPCLQKKSVVILLMMSRLLLHLPQSVRPAACHRGRNDDMLLDVRVFFVNWPINRIFSIHTGRAAHAGSRRARVDSSSS